MNGLVFNQKNAFLRRTMRLKVRGRAKNVRKKAEDRISKGGATTLGIFGTKA